MALALPSLPGSSGSSRDGCRNAGIARTIADLLGKDGLDAGCLLETPAYRDVDPTVDLVPQVRILMALPADIQDIRRM